MEIRSFDEFCFSKTDKIFCQDNCYIMQVQDFSLGNTMHMGQFFLLFYVEENEYSIEAPT